MIKKRAALGGELSSGLINGLYVRALVGASKGLLRLGHDDLCRAVTIDDDHLRDLARP